MSRLKKPIDYVSARYGMEVDVLLGEKLDWFVKKTNLASFLLKRCHPHAKCLLVYKIEEVDPTLLRLTEPWIDRVCHFSMERDETPGLC